jgi:uncharacterized repeat protein (TIGR01451 family)
MTKLVNSYWPILALCLSAWLPAASAQNCDPDITPPTCQAPPSVTISCEDFDASLVTYGTATVADNCCLDTVLVTTNYSQFDTICHRGTITRTFRSVDCSGNSSTLGVVQAVQTIVVNYEQNYFVRFPDDVLTDAPDPNGFYGVPTFSNNDCELEGIGFEDEIFTSLPNSGIQIKRTWSIINWCSYNPQLPLNQIPNPNPNAIENHVANLPGPIVSAPGTPIPWQSTIVKITPDDPTATDFSTFWEANANGYRYTQTITILGEDSPIVTGNVFVDETNNCALDAGEPALAGWTVQIVGLTTGNVYHATADVNGTYAQVLPAADNQAQVSVASPANLAQNCPGEFTVPLTTGQMTTQDLPVKLVEECPLLTVDIATNFLRRCFSSNYYQVKACNLSANTIPDATVEITLDEYLTYISSTLAAMPLPNNAYEFSLGSLAAGECRTFSINLTVSCDAPLGYTHCSSARISPDTLCDWTKAEITADGQCDGDSVRFEIRNVGASEMDQELEFVVVEDVIMYQADQFQLGVGATRSVAVPANGSTWRIETPQEPGHPWGGPVSATVEGCGGLNTPGLVTLFPINDRNPFSVRSCVENLGSFDPNDKSAVPQGYGNEHFINKNTPLEYLVRFQNTGTDTAFNVVILDTISAHLEVASVRTGAASHDFNFSILEGNVLRFAFPDILLPDSNTNEVASHGFVKFQIAQKPELPDATRIENRAAIYFDFNEPVITNTTFHTIGDHFISVSTDEAASDGLLRAYPNPASDAVFFDLKDWANDARFLLTNSLGQVVANRPFSAKQYRFERQNLPAGIYYFQITAGHRSLANGKMMLR